MVWSSLLSRSCDGRHIRFILAMATVASIRRPMVTFAESPREKERQARTAQQQQGGGGCPAYGCVLLPRDIFYDKKSQQSLEQLRDAKEEEEQRLHESGASSAASIGADTTTSDTTSSSSSTTTASSTAATQEATETALLEMLMSGDEDMATLTLIGYKGGDPHHQINQDRAFVIAPFSFCDDQDKPKYSRDYQHQQQHQQRLMGVFDGHANWGERVSEFSVQQVPKLLASKLNQHHAILVSNDDNDDNDSNDNTARIDIVRTCLEETFREVDQRAPAYPSGGCTATVVLQLGQHVFLANAGDSASFIVVHQPSTHTTEIVCRTREDKPDLPDERERVEKMGGRVYIPDSRAGSTPRVIYYDRSTGSQSGLAMSRSIGDWDAGRVGVIPDPIVDVINLDDVVKKYARNAADSSNDDDDDDDVHIFAVSASDGMMDFLDGGTIASVLASSLFDETADHPLTACERLISIAAASWQRAKEGRYRDDIAIAVTKLRTPLRRRGTATRTTTAKEEL